MPTPDQVHYGQADEIHTVRQNTLDAAFDRSPERFVRKEPEPPAKPTTTWIRSTVGKPEHPSLNSKPGCLKVVDTFRLTREQT